MNLPFRKKKAANAPNMPPEVQQYYKSERREQTGIAWLLAIATLLITIAIILGLFFGGRWVYRKIKNRNTTTTTQTQSNTTDDANKNTSSSSNESSKSSGSNGSATAGSGSSTQNNASTANGSAGSSASSSAAKGSSTSSGTSSNGSASTSTGVVPPTAARTSIPNTGPGDTVAVFIGVTIAGYLIHRYLIAAKK